MSQPGNLLKRLLPPCLRLLLLLCAAAASPALLRGQMDCAPPWHGGESQAAPICYTEPEVGVTPEGLATGQPNVPVQIVASDYFIDGGDPASYRVYLDNADVTAQWPATMTVAYEFTTRKQFTLRSSGNVALSEEKPRRVLRVKLCDTATLCTEVEREYVLRKTGVEVGPDNASDYMYDQGSYRFLVKNTGTEAATFNLTARCRLARTVKAYTCAAEKASVTLGPQAEEWVGVTYSGQGAVAGVPVVVTLTAVQANATGVTDQGWANLVRVAAGGATPTAPSVALVGMTNGAASDRGDCVTVAVAARAAYECGDLRIAHPLPALHTRGRAWSMALLYNSQHAHPRPTLYADITRPAGSAWPERVEVVVTLATGAVHRAEYLGTHFAPGVERRVAVQWDGLNMPTGVYTYQLQVINHYPGQALPSAVKSGILSVVNRSGSPFGPGWWLAGRELICGSCGTIRNSILWVGGDGSTRMYQQAAVGAPWVAQLRDGPPDTLFLANGTWTRRLRGGGRVDFDLNGNHVRTVNRLGQVTSFDIDDSNVLTAVRAPAGGSATPTWTLVYAGGLVQRMDAAMLPGGATRSVTLGRAYGDRRVTSITDPHGASVELVSNVTGIVVSQRDRRGTYTRYEYDTAQKLWSARTLMNGAAISPGDIERRFDPVESKGVVAPGQRGELWASINAYTWLHGPRTDVADNTFIWLNAAGEVARTVDATGVDTYLQRLDTRFPGLVTQVTRSSGGRQTVTYDARGRVAQAVDVDPRNDGMNDTTSYTWDDQWDQPRTVASTSGTRESMEYDPATGNVLWRQRGLAHSGTGMVSADDERRRTFFSYYPAGHPAAGQLASVRQPEVNYARARDSLVYDARGNLRLTMSPTGLLTLHHRDALGHDSIVYTPVADDATARDTAHLKLYGTQHRTYYDGAGRPYETQTVGQSVAHAGSGGFTPAPSASEMVTVRTGYDGEGLPLWVQRWSDPDPALINAVQTVYGYDAAGRKIREVTEPDGERTWEYDAAGNAVVEHTPRGHAIRTRYDAMNRPVLRVVPGVGYPRVCDRTVLSDNTDCQPFPRFPNNGTGYLVPEEWTHLRYDGAGRLAYAENADAIVQRTYHTGGALRTDWTGIRSVGSMRYDSLVYELGYTYDRGGRLATVRHPGALAAAGADTDRYAYDPLTGALTTATSRLGHAFTMAYDLADRMTSMRMPGAVVDSMEYDSEGRLVWRREGIPGAAPLHDERLAYDARGKITHVTNGQSEYHQWYSGLGMLVANNWTNLLDGGRLAEESRQDALGNVVWSRSTREIGGDLFSAPVYDNEYMPGSSRLVFTHKRAPVGYGADFLPDSTAREYDPAGNVLRGYQANTRHNGSGGVEIAQEVETRSYYGADDRLRVLQKYDLRRSTWSNYQAAGVWEEYRYDPLGRRVMVRTRAGDGGGDSRLCNLDSWTCVSSVTHFVWSGDQLLWELKSASSLSASAGGRVSYFHAGGIDRPLVITKGSTSVIPHQNWRGQFARGTYEDGRRSDCTSYPASGCTPIEWPGERTTVRHETVDDPRIQNWFGGLVDGMRDASGQMYMRNRYYDPKTGQFTQPDPIGIAGGMNSYGFAAGDPVSYSDPYGLKIQCVTAEACSYLSTIYRNAVTASLSDDPSIARSGAMIVGMFDAMNNDQQTLVVGTQRRGFIARWMKNEANSTGTCSRVEGICDGSASHFSTVDPDFDQGKGVSAEVRMVHELGHGYAYIVQGLSSDKKDSAQHDWWAVEFENHYRNIRGCDNRASHAKGADNPSCQ